MKRTKSLLILSLCFTPLILNSCGIEYVNQDFDEKSRKVYELAKENGVFLGTYEEWLETIKGEPGLSAYEIYLKYHPDYVGNEQEWIEDLAHGRLGDKILISFSVDGKIISTVEVKPNTKLAEPETPIKDGYIFDGWYYGNDKWDFTRYKASESLTLEGRFIQKEQLMLADKDSNLIEQINTNILIKLIVAGTAGGLVHLKDLKVTCDVPNVMTINGDSISFNKTGKYKVIFENSNYFPLVINVEITDKKITRAIVEKASNLSLQELEIKSQKEMIPGKIFKIVGSTLILAKAADLFAKYYDWFNYVLKGPETDKYNIYVNNSYKPENLFVELKKCSNSYFADFSLIQSSTLLANANKNDLLFNFAPNDYVNLGLAEKDSNPLVGIRFNKVFFYNKNLLPQNAFNNIWQLAGTKEDLNHLDNLSMLNANYDIMNGEFLLSLYSPINQQKLMNAYKAYYGIDYKADSTYSNITDKFIHELINNVTTWHTSDGTAMRETQCTEKVIEGQNPYIYYGAFGKMKDAAKKNYDLDLNPDTPNVNAMSTVKWDNQLHGLNGYMYNMYSQICNNAENPYTACLFARFLLLPETYKTMCYNELTPNKDGTPGNQYGYYSPCTTDLIRQNDNDWSTTRWAEESVSEDYSYLSTLSDEQIIKVKSMFPPLDY